MQTVIVLHFLIALVVSRFQKKPRVLLATKMSQEIFFEYRLMAQQCMDTCIEFIDFMFGGTSLTDYSHQTISKGLVRWF